MNPLQRIASKPKDKDSGHNNLADIYTLCSTNPKSMT